MGDILHPGFLYWDGLKYITTGGSSLASGPAGGDLSGSYPNPIISGLQGNPISNAAPTAGQVLEWNGTSWTPTTLANSFSAAGDLSGNATTQVVIGIQGNPVTAQSLGIGQADYTFVWNGSSWSAQPLGGDLGDGMPSPTVRKLWGAYVPEAGTGVPPGYSFAGNAFSVGNVLQIINQTPLNYALGYAPLNLSYTSGTLSADRQAAQTMSGNVTGTTSSNTVVSIQDNPVSNLLLVSNILYDGYVLTWSYADERWEAKPSVTGSTLSGDVNGAVGSNTVDKILGIPLDFPGIYLVAGAALEYNYNGSEYVWFPQMPNITLTGDTTGSYTGSIRSASISTTLENIKGKTLDTALASLGSVQDGYVLTWNNTANKWEALQAAGSSGVSISGDLGGFSGDVLVIGIQGNPISATAPLAYQVLAENSTATGSAWSLITDNNVAAAAAISGDKISPKFYDNNPVQCNSFLASDTVETYQYTVGHGLSAPPSITAGSGFPGPGVNYGAATLNNGSIYLRTDGIADGYESLYAYAAGAWVAIAASAAGSASGDLSGSYPAPTVTHLQTHPIQYTSGITNGYILTWDGTNNWWSPTENVILSTNFSGDLSGYFPTISVIKLYGNAVKSEVLSSTQDGYVLTWQHATGGWQSAPNNITGTAGGDLSGSYPNPTVVKLQGHAIASTTPTDTYVLTWNGGASHWQPSVIPTQTATGSASGDLSGSYPGPTVAKIQGKTLASSLSSIGSAQDGYVLTWTYGSTDWEAKPVPSTSTITLSGDVTGASNSNTVVNIHGASVPIAGSLIDGYVLQVTGTSTLSYAPINIAGGSNYITGVLPNGNQQAQAMGGDATGTTASATITALRGKALAASLASLGSSQDGYVLTWNNSVQDWEAKPLTSGSFTAGGDLTGTSTSQTVHSIQGVVITGAAATGYVLEASSPTAATWVNAPSGSFTAGGDLSGSSTSQNVIAIHGHAVSSVAPTDGYVLTWDNADGYWKPEQISGGGGGETGKVIFTSKTVTSSYSIDASEYDYYIFCNHSAPISITLPNPTIGRTVVIKDISGSAFINNITVLQYASENIEGANNSFVISSDNGSITLAADNAGNWWIV